MQSLPLRSALTALVTAMALCTTLGAHAADGAPLKILVGYAPGGGSDTLARVLADELRTALGRTVIVENKPGAGGRIAAEALKNAPGDGNTLMVAPNGLTTVQSIVYKAELRYDPAKDLIPVAKLTSTPIGIAVSSNTKATDAKQLAAWVKANPGSANFGSPAAGGMPHFVGLLTSKAMGSPWNHVAYKGGAPVTMAVISGELPIGISTIDDFVQQEQAGKLKIAAIAGAKRSELLPATPTLLEQGFDVRAEGWSALWTSPGTSAAQIETFSSAVKAILEKPAVKAKLRGNSMAVDYLNAADMGAMQKAEWAKWTPVVEASGFKPGN